jgi:hypothetical protein
MHNSTDQEPSDDSLAVVYHQRMKSMLTALTSRHEMHDETFLGVLKYALDLPYSSLTPNQ